MLIPQPSLQGLCRVGRAGGLAVALAIVTAFGLSGDAGAAPSRLLPNLHAMPAQDVRFGTATIDGTTHTVIRFSAVSYNDGAGPLELRAAQHPPADGNLHKVSQHFKLSDGTWDPDADPLGAENFVWDDGHNHFHFADYAKYTLSDPTDPDAAHRRHGSKTTFCIIDTTRIDTKLPGAPKKAEYRTCGALRQGMSVGWGDRYGYSLPGQWIDVDGLTANGTYVLRITVNPGGRVAEADETGWDGNKSELEVCIDFEAEMVAVGACGESGGADEKPGKGNGRNNRPPRGTDQEAINGGGPGVRIPNP
ncbi:MAG: lysyl oxidase family protein [Chloroflexi bacterium]|nr:lysyl oxidase family protein [Chloroflexota bacterium]